jgi:hypothetical protein
MHPTPFQQGFNRKEHKQRRDKNLWHFFFALQSVSVAHFREDLANGIFNAKTQEPKGAKSSLRLGVFAPLRLCVERSSSSVKSVKSVVKSWPFVHFGMKSTQPTHHEHLTTKIEPFQTNSNQGNSR